MTDIIPEPEVEESVFEPLEPLDFSFPGDDSPINKKDRARYFMKAHWRGVVCILTPLIFICFLVPFPPQKYQWCAYTLMVMAVYWVTECIPLPITSFLPVLIFPMTGVMNTRNTCNCYINDTVVMYLGSLILAYAVEQSGLHKRLALCAIRMIGYSHYRLLFAMSFTTMFVSMWITNTAATTMMVPINFAVLKVFEDQNLLSIFVTDSNGDTVASDIATCYFCAASFSATIGGIGTIVGTATNLVFKGLFTKGYPDAPEYLSFPNFSAFAIPYMVAMEGCLYLSSLIMYFGFLRPNSKAAQMSTIPVEGIEVAKIAVAEDWKKLGKITFWEIMVIILFSGAMLMFFCRSPQVFVGWGDSIQSHFGLSSKFIQDSAVAMLVGFLMFLLPSTLEFFKNCTEKGNIQDSAVAMLVGFLMFLLPSTLEFFKNCTEKDIENLPNKPVRSILDWTIMNEVMPYSFMFLLGGGFALSEASKKEYSDLNGKIGDMLKSLSSLPINFVILLIIIFTVFITNFASNVAVCNVVAPIAMQLAAEIKTHPLWFNITAGFSSSYCFCLPVGTPGNLIVQGAAKIPTGKMIKAGIFPTISSILLTWFFICFWAPVIWPDLYTFPAWIPM